MMKLYKIPLQKLSPSIHFESRDGSQKMCYRHFPSWSTHTLVLFHGLVSSSIYLCPLAHRIAERKIAQVIIPDWRGHGEDLRPLHWPKPYSAIQDFEEMMIHFKSRTAVEGISMLGHSFGVRWLWKILESTTLKIDCSYLVSPYLSDQQISSDWFKLQGDRYQVNWPKELQTGKEKFEYPMPFLDYFKMDQQEVDKRNVHLIEASDDEILSPLKNLNTKSHFIIPQATHMGIVMQPQNIDLICDFIESNTRG